MHIFYHTAKIWFLPHKVTTTCASLIAVLLLSSRILDIFQISKDTFDESPFAYRPLDDIAEVIKDIPVNDEDIFNTCM